jgi:tetratricopeptide (TPR) repeat protein
MRRIMAIVALAAALGAGVAAAQSYRVSDAVVRAMTLLQQKDYAGALAEADKAVARDPKDPVALATRGSIHAEMGNFQKAMADQDGVLAMQPKDPGALTNACWTRAAANVELDRALAYCDQAVAAARSRRFAPLDTRGFLHYRRGEFDLAVADYDAALKDYHGRLASSLYGRGLAELRLGKEAEGHADLAAAVKAQADIAGIYAKRGATP